LQDNRKFAWKVSKNDTKTVWVLKGDIKKFFASIDHVLLKKILAGYIVDKNILWLLSQIIDSFETQGKSQVGLPLGNLTSQLFINIYMNRFDQFVKHKLRAKYYVRYTDDFVILSENKIYLGEIIPKIANFLIRELKLTLHPDKLYLKTMASGVDFLGWVHLPKHRVLRTATPKRMFKKLNRKHNEQSIASYLGLLKHGNTYKLA